jgi:ketosteroid isomerase-like protein
MLVSIRGVMPTEADVAVVRRFHAALAAGDLAAARKCFREDAVWHLPDTSRIAGTHRGSPAYRDDFFSEAEPPQRRHVSSAGPRPGGGDREYIVAVGKGIAEHAGRWLDVTVCQLMRVQDGRIVEVRGHHSDHAALDAFWGI